MITQYLEKEPSDLFLFKPVVSTSTMNLGHLSGNWKCSKMCSRVVQIGVKSIIIILGSDVYEWIWMAIQYKLKLPWMYHVSQSSIALLDLSRRWASPPQFKLVCFLFYLQGRILTNVLHSLHYQCQNWWTLLIKDHAGKCPLSSPCIYLVSTVQHQHQHQHQHASHKPPHIKVISTGEVLNKSARVQSHTDAECDIAMASIIVVCTRNAQMYLD